MKTRVNVSELAARSQSYESGELTPDQEIDLFADLVKSGMAWKFQGHYGRVATAYIENGFLRRDGAKLKDANGEPCPNVPPEKPRAAPKIPLLTPREVLANPSYNAERPSMSPFEFVERYEAFEGRASKGGRFVVALISFGAYNALGLVGPEKGGLAFVLEAPERAVIATRDIPYSMGQRDRAFRELLAGIKGRRDKAEALRDAVKAEGGWEWRGR